MTHADGPLAGPADGPAGADAAAGPADDEQSSPLELVAGEGGRATLVLRGEVDLHAVETAGADLDDRLRTVDAVESSEVTFIDSMGLHCLITAAVAARARGEKVRLVRPSRSVLQMLEITAMTDFFAVEG